MNAITHPSRGSLLATVSSALAETARRDPKNWKITGKSVARLETAPKLNGSQVYGMDLRLPGMLNAAIHACPVFGGKISSIDSKAAEAMRGVKHVLRVGENAVVVVADA